MTDKLKVLDLFAGIGGFSLGLHKTGKYETVAFCEWDKSCQKVLQKNFPGVPIYGDIKTLKWCDDFPYKGTYLYSKDNSLATFTDIDILCGGFPCQDISYAGKGAGLEGQRSGHWFEYLRLIEEIQPKAVIIENVSALLTRGLGTVLYGLHTVGYDAEWHCIPASHFGASHSRDRVWIIAYRSGSRGKRLVPFQYPSQVGQRGWGGKEDLQQVYSNPFGRSNRWPEPLLRRMDVPVPRRLDRLKQCGNSIYWPIVEALGHHIVEQLA